LSIFSKLFSESKTKAHANLIIESKADEKSNEISSATFHYNPLKKTLKYDII
jgi:hypothetical protein